MRVGRDLRSTEMYSGCSDIFSMYIGMSRVLGVVDGGKTGAEKIGEL